MFGPMCLEADTKHKLVISGGNEAPTPSFADGVITVNVVSGHSVKWKHPKLRMMRPKTQAPAHLYVAPPLAPGLLQQRVVSEVKPSIKWADALSLEISQFFPSRAKHPK